MDHYETAKKTWDKLPCYAPATKRQRILSSNDNFYPEVAPNNLEDIKHLGKDQKIVHNILPFNPLPHLSWADSHSLWCHLKEKDESIKLNADIFKHHPDLDPNMRSVLFEWLSEVCHVLKLKRVTYYMSQNYIDTYLIREVNLSRKRLQLVGITSLFIAAKMNEIRPPLLKSMAYFTDDACAEEDIVLQELICYKVLNWDLNIMTVIDWLGLYFQIWSHKKTQSPNFGSIHFSHNTFIKIAQIIDLCMLDVNSLNFFYSQIAATSLLYYLDKDEVYAITGYDYPMLDKCYNWMNCYAILIFDNQYLDLLPLTELSLNSYNELSHLQTHTIDLQLYEQGQKRYKTLLELYVKQNVKTNTPQKSYSDKPISLLTPPLSSKKSNCIT